MEADDMARRLYDRTPTPAVEQRARSGTSPAEGLDAPAAERDDDSEELDLASDADADEDAERGRRATDGKDGDCPFRRARGLTAVTSTDVLAYGREQPRHQPVRKYALKGFDSRLSEQPGASVTK